MLMWLQLIWAEACDDEYNLIADSLIVYLLDIPVALVVLEYEV